MIVEFGPGTSGVGWGSPWKARYDPERKSNEQSRHKLVNDIEPFERLLSKGKAWHFVVVDECGEKESNGEHRS
jgi:hypothetical protein